MQNLAEQLTQLQQSCYHRAIYILTKARYLPVILHSDVRYVALMQNNRSVKETITVQKANQDYLIWLFVETYWPCYGFPM